MSPAGFALFPTLLFLFSCWLICSSAEDTATVTIQEYPAYTSLRACARNIFDNNNWLRSDGLKCAPPYLDSCFCRADLAPSATTYISNVVIKYCSYGTVDYSAAMGLYNQYCADRGVVPATVDATTTVGSGDSTTVVITTLVTEISQGGSSSISSQLRPGLDVPFLVAAVGVGFVVFVC